MRDGIDVATYQHPNGAPIDYAQVAAAGYSWAAVKVNEGTGSMQPYAADDVAGFAGAGLEVVLYHFARPAVSGATAAARQFASYCAALAPDAARCVDIEDQGGLSWADLAAWLDEFAAASGTSIDYMNRYFRSRLATAGYGFTRRLWLANPDNSVDLEGCYAVQHGQGQVPGIAAVTDLDHVADVAPPPAPTPAPTPEPAPQPEGDDMDEHGLIEAIRSLYAIAGNADVAGQLGWARDLLGKPRDQWAASLAFIASLLHG